MSAPALALPRSLEHDGAIIEPASRQEVAELAYALWQERGSPIGSPEEDWLEAERWLGAQPVAAVEADKRNLP